MSSFQEGRWVFRALTSSLQRAVGGVDDLVNVQSFTCGMLMHTFIISLCSFTCFLILSSKQLLLTV